MKFSTVAAFGLTLLLPLSLGACSPGADGKESGLMTAARAVFAFKACTSKLEQQFKLGPINSVSSDDMDPIATGKPGEWDVRFTASVTEKESGRVTRYKGVCRVRRDRATTLEAVSLGVVKPASNAGEVRRTNS